jgi:aromatic-L-amino-acid/L-tryptophan decarboxylase
MKMIETTEKDQVTAAPSGTGQATPFSFDGPSLQRYGYQVMDEVSAYLSGIAERPVWQAMPESVREEISAQELPQHGHPFEETLAFLRELILPYPQGNGHPRFAGWINSAPAHAAILMKPLAAAMNPNCGIGDHAGQELERRTVQWLMELCGFPVEGSVGVFVSGGSEAQFTCLQTARYWAAGGDKYLESFIRKAHLQKIDNSRLIIYNQNSRSFISIVFLVKCKHFPESL